MNQYIRTLNDHGLRLFVEYLDRVRDGSSEQPPYDLLTSVATSDAFEPEITVSRMKFQNRYELGVYLHELLSTCNRYEISRNAQLWNWFSLFFFETICAPDNAGKRKMLRPEMYFLSDRYNWLRYYKHLVRSPWFAVTMHGQAAEFLFLTVRGIRSDIEETFLASQQIAGNRTLIAAASDLYFDETKSKPKVGASGKGAGSPRRLTLYVQQLARTYDIQSCSKSQFLSMLPEEFDRYRLG